MATVYFSAYKGPGVSRPADIHPDNRRAVERRCEALTLAVTGFAVGQRATGAWRGLLEPSFVADHLDTDVARLLARTACTVFGQEAVLVWTYGAPATHVRVTVSPVDAWRVLTAILPDGYTILEGGRHVFILPRDTPVAHLLEPEARVEYGTAEFVTSTP